MPQLTLTYLDLPGRAEGIRQALKLTDIPFTDERLSSDALNELKPSLPYKKVPVLSIDGQIVAETQPILRYVGRLGGLYPPSADPLACLMVDEMLDSMDDLFERVLMPSFVEKDQEKKQQMRLQLMEGPLPEAFARLQKRLEQVAEYPFFKANTSALFVHHVAISDWVGYFRSGEVDHIPVTFMDDYKALSAIHDMVTKTTNVSQQSIVSTPVQPPKKLKLTYFGMPGRAEQTRLALHIGGIEFEDERISFEECAERKQEFPNDQLPVLDVDGHVCAQSLAILRYVGTLTGLYPVNDAVEAAKIDEVLSHINELYYALDESFQEQDADKKRKLREELAVGPIPESFGSLNSRIEAWKSQKKSTSPYAMGDDQLTIADLVIYAIVQFFSSGFLDHVPTSILDPYKHLVEASDAVKNCPRVQDWYAQHPQA